MSVCYSFVSSSRKICQHEAEHRQPIVALKTVQLRSFFMQPLAHGEIIPIMELVAVAVQTADNGKHNQQDDSGIGVPLRRTGDSAVVRVPAATPSQDYKRQPGQ